MLKLDGLTGEKRKNMSQFIQNYQDRQCWFYLTYLDEF